ncbi:MAG: DUF4424 family protein [Nitrospirota bacterium]|nr:DUF4424 family protein [Nitrospirota bacterium]
MVKQVAIVVFALLISSYGLSAAYGNDTFVYDNGRTAYPINTDKIRMAEEKIIVMMLGDGFSRKAKVTCDFIFENITDKEVSAKIGFPAEDQYYHDIGEGEKRYPPLRDFVALVDGKKTQVNIRTQEDKYPVLYWYTWDVTFPPSRRITIRNVYETGLSLSYYNQWFTYILTTGANWKGPIGHSEVEVVYDSVDELRKRVKSASPDNFKISGSKIVWDFINLIPKENIQVYENNMDREGYLSDPTHRLFERLADFFRKKEYVGGKRDYTEQDLDIRKINGIMSFVQQMKNEYAGNVKSGEQLVTEINLMYLRLLRNEVYAKHGRYFDSEYLRKFFMKVGGYNSGPEFNEASLNAYERKNVESIAAFEGKLKKH